MHFFHIKKTTLKIEKKVKTRIIAIILGSWEWLETLQIPWHLALFLDALQGMVIVFELYRKK